jgi:hypothetical protein
MANVRFDDWDSDGDRSNAANWTDADTEELLGRVPDSGDHCTQAGGSTSGNVTCNTYTTSGFDCSGDEIICNTSFSGIEGGAMSDITVTAPTINIGSISVENGSVLNGNVSVTTSGNAWFSSSTINGNLTCNLGGHITQIVTATVNGNVIWNSAEGINVFEAFIVNGDLTIHWDAMRQIMVFAAANFFGQTTVSGKLVITDTGHGDYYSSDDLAGAADVRVGVVNGPETGTYDPAPAAVAAQLATDIAAVNAAKADIKNTRTLLTVTGTYNPSTDSAAAAAAQLVTDVAAVTAAKAGIRSNTTILGVQGTYSYNVYKAAVSS